MNILPLELKDCLLIEPKIFEDDRGYFFESFSEKTFNEKSGLNIHFLQDNQSFSSYGVLRGLHFQKGEHAQAKLVRVIQGEVLDVAVDVRSDSSTYRQWISVLLSAQNKKQLFIPRGFAHGFVVLSETAEFFYKCDNYYNKMSEGGIHYADPDLAIDWIIPENESIVSDKDKVLPFLKEVSEF